MAGFNPCYCWNLKDGCVTVGIWTLMFSFTQLGLFGWQTYILNECRVILFHDFLYCQDYCPCARNRRVDTTQAVLQGLFVIQILNLIAAFFLLFASVSLIYGIHTSSKYLVWPWFPCIAAAIICSLAYCVMWWVGDVTSYWLVLTIVEIISVFINLYCLFCVIVQYRRIVRGYLPASEDDSLKNQRLVGYDYPYRPGETGALTYAPEKKVGEGVWNVVYEPEGSPRSRVHVYGKDAYGGPPGELVAYSAEPIGHIPQEPVPDEREEAFPCSKSEMTEEWLKNVMSSHPEEPKIPVLDQPPSPGKEWQHGRSRSYDALHKDTKDKGRRSVRSSKSKESISSKHASRHDRRDSSLCSTCSSSSSTIEETTRKGRSRSEGRHRGRAGSDSEDTGYSRSAVDSVTDRKHKHRHHHHKRHHHQDRDDRHRDHHKHRRKHKDKSDDERRSRKRLRDVKREDKERRLQQQQQEAQAAEQAVPPARPETSSSATDRSRLPPGAVPVFPGAGLAPPQGAAISIPQHIVIPPQPKGAPTQPQRFHINSEITISYSDRSAPGSDSEHRPPSGGLPGPQQSAPTVPVLPPSTNVLPPTTVPSISPSKRSTPPIPPPRSGNGNRNGANSPANTSGDSKGYGSTAV